MPFLVAALVLVGGLCVVDLLLTFAVLRRLREHTEQLGRLSGASNSSPDLDRLLGRELPEFSTETVDGAVVSRKSVTGNVELLGFFLPHCGTCHTQAPLFVDKARTIGAGKALAVVTGSGSDTDDLVQTFRNVTDTVLDPPGGELVSGLHIDAFPTFLRLDSGGVIVAAANSVEDLAEVSQESRDRLDNNQAI